MNKIIKISLLSFAWFFLFFTNSVLAENKIYQIRSNSLADKLQIVVDMAENPSFNAFVLANPTRIVVDIQGRAASNYRNHLTFKQRGVTLVRTGQRSNAEVRLVLDLVADYHWKAYTMRDDGRHPPRIVIDIFDRQMPAPANQVTHSIDTHPIVLTSSTNDPSETPAPIIGQVVLESLNNEMTTDEGSQTQPRTLSAKTKPTKTSQHKTTQVVVKPVKNHQAPSVSTKTTQAKVTTLNKKRPKVAKRPIKKSPKKKVTPAVFETTSKRLKQREIIIVIDPGHGGKDSGAVGKRRTKEKTIVLQIAKRLKRKINAIPGMRAVLTRSTDRYITLRGRLRLARQYKADLFVSIHADAALNRSARGSSVFILSNRGASSESARWLAKRENAVDLKYGVDIGDYDKDVSNVLMKIQQDATIESSYILANKTLGRLKGIGKVHKRRVERAGFAVLKSPDIPSMLVETAFISNPEEEKKLKSSRYQEKVANAIAEGIKHYFDEHLPHHLLLVEPN